jgi:phosphohistidine phosphatase
MDDKLSRSERPMRAAGWMTAWEDAMEVYVLRHGDTEAGAGIPDHKRNLTEEGRRQALASGRALARLAVPRPAVLTSPLVRARQTAELAAAGFAPPAEIRVIEALAPPGDLAGVMGEIRRIEGSSVLLVGHEPFLGRFVYAMIAGEGTAGSVPMRKATMARVDMKTPVAGDGRMIWLIPPEISTELASGEPGRGRS